MFNKIKKIDWPILLILLLFMMVSTLLIHSAIHNSDPRYSNYDIKNVIFYGLGFIVLICTTFFDYRIAVKGALYIYIIGILLLVTVFFFGVDINGARGWFRLPMGLNFQPAELVKLIIIIAVSGYMMRRQGEQLELIKDVIPIGLIVFVPFALVLIQPDLGNAIIYLVILLGMYWIGNIKYTYVLIGTSAIVGFMALFLYLFQTYHEPIQNFLEAKGNGHWVERIDTYINPQEASRDAVYQVTKAKIAIGSGGLYGEGFLKGNSVQNRFIPYAYSDSIFAVIGEEFGFVGSSLVLLLYFLLIYRMILIAIQVTDMAGSYIIIGVVSMFVFQIFEHMGMLIGIMPLTGITLPFISYGGSSLLINMMCVGLVLSIKVHQEKEPSY